MVRCVDCKWQKMLKTDAVDFSYLDDDNVMQKQRISDPGMKTYCSWWNEGDEVMIRQGEEIAAYFNHKCEYYQRKWWKFWVSKGIRQGPPTPPCKAPKRDWVGGYQPWPTGKPEGENPPSEPVAKGCLMKCPEGMVEHDVGSYPGGDGIYEVCINKSGEFKTIRASYTTGITGMNTRWRMWRDVTGNLGKITYDVLAFNPVRVDNGQG